MDKELIAAFKRIEEQFERKRIEEEEQKAAEAERLRMLKIKEDLDRKKRRQAIYIYSSLCCFLILVLYGIHKSQITARSQGKTVASWASHTIKEYVEEIIREEVDCSKPDNWSTSYCINKRKSATDQEWRDISLNKDGNNPAFSVGKSRSRRR
jgi:hypothetical protein